MPRINEPFSIIPHSLWTLPANAVHVYAMIDQKCGKRGHWYGPVRALCAATGYSERTVERCVAMLKDRGYIDTDRVRTADGLVLRYLILARGVPPPEIDPKADPFEEPEGVPNPPHVAVPEPPRGVSEAPHVAGSTIDPLHQPHTNHPPPDRPPTRAREWFAQVFGYEANRVVGDELDTQIDGAHPPECVAWVFAEVAARSTPTNQTDWRLGRHIFGRCMFEGHGPRERRTNGSATNGRTQEPRRARAGGQTGARGKW